MIRDVIFDHREWQDTPLPTMERPGQWRYVADRLVAHMGAYTPDDLNRLHWRWHHRAAFRIREALIRHNVWTILTPLPRGPTTPDRATGHQRQRSQKAQGPLRQVASTRHSQSPHRQPIGMAPPCDPQRSQVRPFAHPWPGYDHQRTPDGSTGQSSTRTPQPPQRTRRSANAQHQSPTPPSAGQQVALDAGDDSNPTEQSGRHRR